MELLAAVVLADAFLIGCFGLFEEVLDTLDAGDRGACYVVRYSCGKAINPKSARVLSFRGDERPVMAADTLVRWE